MSGWPIDDSPTVMSGDPQPQPLQPCPSTTPSGNRIKPTLTQRMTPPHPLHRQPPTPHPPMPRNSHIRILTTSRKKPALRKPHTMHHGRNDLLVEAIQSVRRTHALAFF